MPTTKKLVEISKQYRQELFEKFLQVGQGHPGSVFSIIEILVCLFYEKFIRFDKKRLKFHDKILKNKDKKLKIQYFSNKLIRYIYLYLLNGLY
jgi:transketolase N-terminal domain/subunit